jgi:lysylphosphatidylglycerol synthetase-like protein (DUF2156 family)
MDYTAIAAAVAAAIFWYRGADLERRSPIAWVGASVVLSALVVFALHRGWIAVALAQLGLFLAIAAYRAAFRPDAEERE